MREKSRNRGAPRVDEVSMRPKRTSDGALLRNEQGAILLLGVFLGVFLAAMLYYVVGIAEAIHAREGLQDAADAGAFAAAILHARGMNLVAFVNIVMAALVAVLVACRVVQGLCWVGIGVAAALAQPTFGASLAAVPPLQATLAKFEAAHRGLREPVLETLRVLHGTQRLISNAVPPLAVIDSVLEVSRHHPPARFGVALPGGPRLPVTADRFEVTCGRAGEAVASLVLWPLERMGLGPVAAPLKAAAGTLTGSASMFFCGAGGSNPPGYERRERLFLPRTTAALACEAEARSTTGAPASCEEARRELEAAEPGSDGSCRPEEDCSERGAYARLAQEARRQCRPRAGFSPSAFVFQRHTVAIEYTFRRGRGWVQTDVSRRNARLLEKAIAPCGPSGELGKEWNVEVHRPGRPQEVVPLCAEPHDVPPGEARDGQRATVEHEQVTQLLGCEVLESRRDEPFEGERPLGSNQGREPHRVEGGALLGDERFQLRAVSWGRASEIAAAAEEGVAVAAWGVEAQGDPGVALGAAVLGAGGALGRLSVAQAEFYYDHDGREARSEWLWNMKWTARLVRFRTRAEVPARHGDDPMSSEPGTLTHDDVSSFGAVCKAASLPGCRDLDEVVSAAEGLVLH